MNLLVVEGDFPFWRSFLNEEWRRRNHRTLLVSEAPALWRRGDYDSVEELPKDSHGALDVDRLRQLCEDFGSISGALTLFEPAVGRTLDIQNALELPRIAEGPARALRNKAEQVATLERAGLAVPETVYGTDAATVVRKALAELTFPLICKPSELAGKAGVGLVRDEAELRDGIAAALAEQLPFEVDGQMSSVVSEFGCEQGVLAQQYIEGREYSVEGYVSRGKVSILALTEKLHSGPPLFEELGHLQPARVSAEERDAILEYSIAAVEAFTLRNSFFHLELRLASRGPVFIEINCRLGGDMIGRLLELRSGMNVGETLYRLAAGEQVPTPERWVGAAGVRMATVSAGGRICRLRPPVLRSDREFAVFETAAGGSVPPPKPGGVSRIGYFVAAAAEPDEVEKRLAELASETEVEIEPAS